MKVVLATISHFRIEGFRLLGIDFEAEDSCVDELQTERTNPHDLVKALSKLKARAVARNHPEAIVIGTDSVGYFKERDMILEKPKTKQEARKRLKLLSGKCLENYTGVHMINTAAKEEIWRVVVTKIFMRKISNEEIDIYLAQDNRFNACALGYNPSQYLSSSFIARIEGSYNTVVRAIPLEVVVPLMRELGYKHKDER